MKKILMVLLCVAIVFSTVGCAKGDKPSGGAIGTDSKNDNFPLTKEKVTFTIMATRWHNQGSYEDYAFTKAYEKLTNVHIDWIEATSAEGGKLKALAFQSGDMPDAMMLIETTVSDNDIHTYSKQGVIAELTDLIDKYAPNVKELLYSREDALASCVNSEGKIYSLPLIGRKESYNEESMMYIRKSWMDNLGLEMPKTSQDFYDILTAFKNDDPNGNGKADEIPFAASGLGMWMWSPWGINTWYNRHYMAINDQGKIYFAPITDSTKNALTFYRNLYNADLLDQEIFEGNSTAAKKIIQQGNVGVFGGVDLETYLSQNLCEDYTPMPFFDSGYQGEFNGKATMATKSTTGKHVFLLSEKCENKELFMKWYDYLWTREGTLLRNYGPEGDGYYEMTKDGKIKILDPSIDADLSRGPSWVMGSYGGDRIELADKDNMTWQEKWNKDVVGFDNLKKVYGDQLAEKNIGSLFFNEDEAYAIGDLGDTYSHTYWVLSEFVTGARNIDTGWNTFVEDVVRKGINDTIAIYQAAYDRQHSDN